MLNESISALDVANARKIASLIGVHVEDLAYAGSGVASIAWLIPNSMGNQILKVERLGSQRQCTYRSEARLLNQLSGKTKLAPLVLAVSGDSVTQSGGNWILLEASAGEPVVDGDSMPIALVDSLGNFLCTLHQLPYERYGPLIQAGEKLAGDSADVCSGLRSRWRYAQSWPFDLSALDAHPLRRRNSRLLNRIQSATLGISRNTFSLTAVLHSDLHREHLLAKSGALINIIDFGGAFIGPVGWEFAAIALFLGWPTCDRVTEVYASSRVLEFSRIQFETAMAALLFGLYRYDAEHRRGQLNSQGEVIEDFLRAAVSRLAGTQHA